MPALPSLRRLFAISNGGVVIFLLLVTLLPSARADCDVEYPPAICIPPNTFRERSLISSSSSSDSALAYKLEDNELTTIKANCADMVYQGFVVGSPGPHIFLGAAPLVVAASSSSTTASTADCPPISFNSMGGERVVLKSAAAEGEVLHPDIKRWDLGDGGQFKLGDFFGAFEQVEPIDEASYDLVKNGCVHFAVRIMRKLGIEETKEVADFIVDSLIAHTNDLLWRASNKAGGASLLAAVLSGPKTLRSHIADLVNTQMNIEASNGHGQHAQQGPTKLLREVDHRGLAGADQDTSRQLDREGCPRKEMYNVFLALGNFAVAVFIQPADKAMVNTCSSYLLESTHDWTSLELSKHIWLVEDTRHVLHGLGNPGGSLLALGSWEYFEIIKAFEDTKVEGLFHVINNNHGHFVAQFFHELGYTPTAELNAMIANGLLWESAAAHPQFIASIRSESPESYTEMSDAEILMLLVEIVENAS